MTAPSPDPEHVVAGAASDRLRTALLGPATEGRVLAAFPRAVYLELRRPPADGAPSVVSLVTSNGTVHPNSIVVADVVADVVAGGRPGPLRRCRPGQHLTFGDGRLVVHAGPEDAGRSDVGGVPQVRGGRRALELHVTRWWASRPSLPVATTAALRAALRQLAASTDTTRAAPDATRAAPDATRAAPDATPRTRTDTSRVALDDPAASRAIARALVGALLCGDAPEAERVALQLIGRGPGLTPSGDDVLCGLFSTATLLTPHALVAEVAERLASHARERTTSISAALLWYAARGCATGELADLLRAIVGADRAPRSAVGDALARLLSVGSTSGRDLAIGVHAGLEFVLSCRDGTGGPVGRATAAMRPGTTSHADIGTGARPR